MWIFSLRLQLPVPVQYLFSLCCSDNFRMCQSACERGGWPSLTSELSWKPVDCDWLLVDSGAPFSAISNEAASHYRGTSPFPAYPENFLLQMEAVFLWSHSQLLKFSFGHGTNMIIVKSGSKCIFIAWLMDHVVNNSHTELSFDTFWWLEASGFKPLFLELFSEIFQLMIQHVFLKIAHGCKMVLMSTQVLLKEPSIQVEHQMPMQPVFLAYNRNRRVTEWRSHQWFWCQKSTKNQMLHRLIHLPRCQLVSLDVRKVFIWKVRKRRVEIQKHVLRGHFPFHADLLVSLALHNFLIWKNQESEFAIGLRSLVFWGHFQIIMQWRYTPIQKRLLEHWVGKLMWEGHWRLTSLHRVSHHKLQKVRFEKKKGKVQLLYCVLHWKNKEQTGWRMKENYFSSNRI